MIPEHFTEDQWSDFVRGVLPAGEAAALQQHLEEGCETCKQSFRLWQMVVAVADSEVCNEVPEALVRSARAAFMEWRRLYRLAGRVRTARLVFDSLLAPPPSGVRSESSASRRFLWQVGEWSCDLCFEPSIGKRIILIGQIIKSRSHSGSVAGLSILLMTAKTLVAETTVNQFGEFQLQFEQANGLRIFIDIPGDRPVAILLPDLDTPSTAGETDTE
jgi:hypothetical protein